MQAETNDSLLLAVGQRLGIDQVATADTDCDCLRGWLVYKPSDLSTALRPSDRES